MSNFKNKTITSKGLELLTSALAGQKLHFTRIVLGSGEYNGDIGMVESLVDQKQSLDIISMSRNGSQVVLTATLTQDKIIEGFYWKEIGVYAKGVDGVEVLYIYGSAKDNEFSYISKDMLNEKMINVGVLVSSAKNITAEISSSLLYLSAQDMINHNNDLKAHEDIRKAIENQKSTIDGNENEIVTISEDNKAKSSGIAIDAIALIDRESPMGERIPDDADTLNGHNAEYFLNKIAENTKQINILNEELNKCNKVDLPNNSLIEYVKSLPPRGHVTFQFAEATDVPTLGWYYAEIYTHVYGNHYSAIYLTPLAQKELQSFRGIIINNVFQGWEAVNIHKEEGITLFNGWSQFPGHQACKVVRHGNRCFLSGMVKKGVIEGGTTILNVPPSFRPQNVVNVLVHEEYGFYLATDGNLILTWHKYSSVDEWYSLDGLSWEVV